MVTLSNDADILRYEPVLFGELHLPWQVLAEGTGGEINGTIFTASGVNFVGAQVQAGGVIYLKSADGVLDGAYEIIAVDSPTQLGVSVIRSDPDGEAIEPRGAAEVAYRISTFGPQASEVGAYLTEYFGIGPGSAESTIDVGNLMYPSVLRRASVFAVISSVYSTLSSRCKDENLWKKSLYYQRLFEKARERCRLSIDINSDGAADVTKVGGCGKLLRD